MLLDERTLALLDFINQNCIDGGYKVFTIQELMQSFPLPFIVDEEGVSESLAILSKNEYICIKYQDNIEVCLSSLSKARREFENRLKQEIENKNLQFKCFLFSFLGGLAGAILGLIILIFVILGWR